MPTEASAFTILMRLKHQEQSDLKFAGRINETPISKAERIEIGKLNCPVCETNWDIPQSGGSKTRGSTDPYKQCWA